MLASFKLGCQVFGLGHTTEADQSFHRVAMNPEDRGLPDAELVAVLTLGQLERAVAAVTAASPQ